MNDPRSIAIHNDVIYVADASNHRIQAFDRNGTFLFKAGGSGNEMASLTNLTEYLFPVVRTIMLRTGTTIGFRS